MDTPKYSPLITLGSIVTAALAIFGIIGATVAWGFSYGSLNERVMDNTESVAAVTARLNAKDAADILIGNALVELRIDLSYIRRWIEELKREKKAASLIP